MRRRESCEGECMQSMYSPAEWVIPASSPAGDSGIMLYISFLGATPPSRKLAKCLEGNLSMLHRVFTNSSPRCVRKCVFVCAYVHVCVTTWVHILPGLTFYTWILPDFPQLFSKWVVWVVVGVCVCGCVWQSMHFFHSPWNAAGSVSVWVPWRRGSLGSRRFLPVPGEVSKREKQLQNTDPQECGGARTHTHTHTHTHKQTFTCHR